MPGLSVMLGHSVVNGNKDKAKGKNAAFDLSATMNVPLLQLSKQRNMC